MTVIKPFAVTMGEPSGIGPEITVRAWRARIGRDVPPFFVIGDPTLYARDVAVQEIDDPAQAIEIFDDALPVLPLALSEAAVPGELNVKNAGTVIGSIEAAVKLALVGDVGGVVTNPIHKAALYNAGFNHPGHTEFITSLCGGQLPLMMLSGTDLRVVPLTIHIPLKDVPQAVTQDLIIQKARIVAKALQDDFDIEKPRLAFAGLNPHAGEDGSIGTEDRDVMAPAIEKLRGEGLDVSGPLPADTMFHQEARAAYDVALCAYHDQALIPLKTLDFHGGVNITLGLPVVRTSPDHGTALGIAGQGLAKPDSLIAALKTAASIAKNRLA